LRSGEQIAHFAGAEYVGSELRNPSGIEGTVRNPGAWLGTRHELPTAELHVIHNAGHLPQEEQPAAFADVVLAWLLLR
jgi:pimeloyl-ACP methyl ester carboxylesterase